MIYHGIPIRKKNHTEATNKGRLKGFKNLGTVGCTPNSVPMAFVVFLRGFSGIITPKYPLYRAYKGVSHRGTLVGAHPTIPWKKKNIFCICKIEVPRHSPTFAFWCDRASNFPPTKKPGSPIFPKTTVTLSLRLEGSLELWFSRSCFTFECSFLFWFFDFFFEGYTTCWWKKSCTTWDV